MRTTSMFLALSLGLLLASHAAGAQIVVRTGVSFGPPPRAYYGPRFYYPPRPAVVAITRRGGGRVGT